MTAQERDVVLKESGWKKHPDCDRKNHQWFWIYSEGKRGTKAYRELTLGWNRGRCRVFYWVDKNKHGVQKIIFGKLADCHWNAVSINMDVIDRGAESGIVCEFYLDGITEETLFVNRQYVYERVCAVKSWFEGSGFLSENYLRDIPVASLEVDVPGHAPESDKAEPPAEDFVDNELPMSANPFSDGERAVVVTVDQLLMMNLRIPSYQRPYKWSRKNVEELLQDIRTEALDKNNKYRLGTVILDASRGGGVFDIVDGQQRVLTLLLINRLLNGIRKNEVKPPILDDDETMKFLSRYRVTRKNLHENYAVIKSCLAKDYELRKRLISAFGTTVEMVLIKVDELPEAFQLFDSQNTRGRELDPHDLLKAFHLRAMRERARAYGIDPTEAEAEVLDVVREWEGKKPESLKSLFDEWLFRIDNWSKKRRTHKFTSRDIDAYKGVPFDSEYSFALRAKAAMPTEDGEECRRLQIGEDFEEGRDFFRMTSHYLDMVEAAKGDRFLAKLPEIKDVLNCADGRGFSFAERLFRCALVAYVDRFGEEALEETRVIRKLCLWAFTLRLDMNHVSEDSINKYAVIESGADYTNQLPMFSIIKTARKPSDIAIADVCGIDSCRFRRKQGIKGREKLVEALKKLED